MIGLKALGLSQYAAAFGDNEIDGDVLPNLTPEDLEALGVRVVGRRRKLLAAIAELPGSTLPDSHKSSSLQAPGGFPLLRKAGKVAP